MGYIEFPRMTVLKGFYEALGAIIGTRFITSRPAVTGEDLTEYAVIRMPSGIRDRGDTYQTSKVLIHLFVRDRKTVLGTIENTWRLDELIGEVCGLFPLVEERFTATEPNLIGSGEDSGFHYVIIQTNVTINKKRL